MLSESTAATAAQLRQVSAEQRARIAENQARIDRQAAQIGNVAQVDAILERAGGDGAEHPAAMRLSRHLRVVPAAVAIVACVGAGSLRAEVQSHQPASLVTHSAQARRHEAARWRDRLTLPGPVAT